MYHALSERGSREVNEDSIAIIRQGIRRCFVVADGLGGHGKGDVASSLAVKAFSDVFSEAKAPLPDSLTDAFLNAQSAILAEQRRLGNHSQMKTTVCALAMDADQLAWGHIGDTRLYAFARNKVKTRTLDHSVPQMLVFAGDIKEKEIRGHPDRNKLLRVLGDSDGTPKFEISTVQKTRDYQAFLLCSDGFWELILEKEMCLLLKTSVSAEDWLRRMAEVVSRRGAGMEMDNYSAIAIWV